MEGREVDLMGRITAGMTHEIKNVLAIIKESSGLLQDILRLSKGRKAPDPEQINKVALRIQAQVARGDAQPLADSREVVQEHPGRRVAIARVAGQ